MVFIEGYLIGLAMIIFIGPVFFYLLKTTLQYGFGSGLSVALGIVISDLICLIICYLGASEFIQSDKNKLWLAMTAAIILIAMGIKYLVKPNIKKSTEIQLKSYDYGKLFVKGFLVNFINPFVFLVWIGIITFAIEKYESFTSQVIYFTAILLGIFTIDFAKVILAKRIKKFIQPHILKRVYKIIGVLLILFGVRMIIYCFSL